MRPETQIYLIRLRSRICGADGITGICPTYNRCRGVDPRCIGNFINQASALADRHEEKNGYKDRQ